MASYLGSPNATTRGAGDGISPWLRRRARVADAGPANAEPGPRPVPRRGEGERPQPHEPAVGHRPRAGRRLDAARRPEEEAHGDPDLSEPHGLPRRRGADRGPGESRSEERRVGKSVDLGGRRIIKKKKTRTGQRSA